MLNSKGQWK